MREICSTAPLLPTVKSSTTLSCLQAGLLGSGSHGTRAQPRPGHQDPPHPARQLPLPVTSARCLHPPPLLLQPPTHRGPRGPSLTLDLGSCALREHLGDGGATRGSQPHNAGPTGASCHPLAHPPPRPVLPRPPGLSQLPRQSARRLTPGSGPPTRPADPGSEWAQLLVHSGLAVITVKEDAPALNVASLHFEKCIRPRAQLSSQDVDLVCHPSPVRPPPDFCHLSVPLPVLEFRGNGIVQMVSTPGAFAPIHPPRGRVAGSLLLPSCGPPWLCHNCLPLGVWGCLHLGAIQDKAAV